MTSAPTIGSSATRISSPSRTSPRATATTPATMSRMMNGSVTAPKTRLGRAVRVGGSRSFGPEVAARRVASSGVRPRTRSTPRAAVTASPSRAWASADGSAAKSPRTLVWDARPEVIAPYYGPTAYDRWVIDVRPVTIHADRATGRLDLVW